ncbi:MAG: heavy metal sensor histidine kinase [Planctomycetia bacterium]|nr:heavy metal sensor histidine kinase [Planctomycetia bacterium]
MNRLAIRWRLTLWYSSILAIILILFGAGVYYLMEYHLVNRLDRDLSAELGGIDEELEESSTKAGVSARLHRRFGHYEHLLFDVRDAGGSEPLFTRRLGESPFPPPRPVLDSDRTDYFTYQAADGSRWRIATRRIAAPGGSLLARVAESLTPDEHELNELLGTLFILGPLALAAAVGGGYALVRGALAPIDRITGLAREISAGRLNERIEIVNRHDELGRLATTLNDMIARLEKSFADMEQFTADAAHELRTPITVMRSEAEVTLRAPRTAEEYRQSLESLLEEFERLTNLADQLLYLCREDSRSSALKRADVQLDQLAVEVADHIRVLAQEKGIVFHSCPFDECQVNGDADGLRRMLFNLLENAVKYTPERGKVTLDLKRRDGYVEIVVSDTGVGIPAEHLPNVFNRFYCVDAARHGGGTGLGLAISRAIVESHGGQIAIESQPGKGTRVTVKLTDRAQLQTRGQK